MATCGSSVCRSTLCVTVSHFGPVAKAPLPISEEEKRDPVAFLFHLKVINSAAANATTTTAAVVVAPLDIGAPTGEGSGAGNWQ